MSPSARDRAAPAVGTLVVLALLYAVSVARGFLLPIILSFILYFLFSPLVRGLHNRLRVPSPLGAGLVLIALIALLAGTVTQLAQPAADWLERAPNSMSSVEGKLRKLREPVEQVKDAAEEVENLTEIGGDDNVREVTIKKPGLAVTLMNNARGLIAHLLLATTLLYFLLASRGHFLHQLIHLLVRQRGPMDVERILRSTERQVSGYLGTVSLINVLLGVAVGTAMHLLGLPNGALWGVMATVLNFVPYVGALVGVGVLGLVSLVTYDTVAQALIPPVVYYGLTALEGTIVTPTVLGKRLSLSPVAILLWLLLWTWLWGIGGALLAVPMLAVFKIVCDHVPALEPVACLLDRGDAEPRVSA